MAEGPFGEAARERRSAGVEREAAFAMARARSGSCIMVVSIDRRDVKLGCESTRRNMLLFSSADELPLSPTSSSSQSEESSSSSMTLSNASSSSSSSDSSNTGLSVMALSWMISLKEACFLGGCGSPVDNEPTLLCPMWLSRELSSSPEEAPRVKVAPFFGRLRRLGWY